MARHGFIHDKLDIKFLILYITARVIEPIPFDTVLELTLCDDAIDYFDFSECLADLVKTEHLYFIIMNTYLILPIKSMLLIQLEQGILFVQL